MWIYVVSNDLHTLDNSREDQNKPSCWSKNTNQPTHVPKKPVLETVLFGALHNVEQYIFSKSTYDNYPKVIQSCKTKGHTVHLVGWRMSLCQNMEQSIQNHDYIWNLNKRALISNTNIYSFNMWILTRIEELWCSLYVHWYRIALHIHRPLPMYRSSSTNIPIMRNQKCMQLQ